jgi:hypothetical protein
MMRKARDRHKRGQSDRRLALREPALLGLLVAAVVSTASVVFAQQVHRNGFEAPGISWQKGAADAPYREAAHDVTDSTAHSGQNSEHIKLSADPGSYIYYIYATGRAPLSDELAASVWLKANRPGTQICARLVLPHERAQGNLDERVTAILRGDQYTTVGRWQRLEVRRPVKLAKEQQVLLRAEFQRDVDISDAYVDRLMLNVYGGPGVTEVWIDDLEIGPLTEAPPPFQTTSRPPDRPERATPVGPTRLPGRALSVELKQDRLVVGGKRFFLRGIRHTDTPLAVLREAGFNALWFDYPADSNVAQEAVNLGFWLVPSLPAAPDAPHFLGDRLKDEASHFPAGDAVLFWDLGGGLVEEQSDAIGKSAELVRAADLQRPVGADIWDGFRAYARTLDLTAVHRWPLMTGLQLARYRQWLQERRNLSRQDAYMWTWVQTHLPDWYTQLVYDRPSASAFQEPIGPQPEQIRLLTYTALAAGYHGLGFWSDRFLADSHQGRDRLLCLALLNMELQMLEPMLVSADEPAWIDTSVKDVKAAVMRTAHGTLVLPLWMGADSQFVPPQGASSKLIITVPDVPVGTGAWQISPAEVRSLEAERVPGGMRVTIPEFALAGAILFTSDNTPTGILVRLQDQVRRMRKLGAQWSHDLAQIEFDKVAAVEGQLEALGHTLPDGTQLMNDARTRLRTCVVHWNNGDFRQAYEEAERSLRPLRILMRAQWEQAVRGLDTPVASPYAVGFFTLPRHWRFMAQVGQAPVGPNVLPDGDFEADLNRTPAGWSVQETKLDGVELSARRIAAEAKVGKQCLMLEIKPQNPALPPRALERTFLAVISPEVRLQPGSLVRVSAWVRVPQPIVASADGALVYDRAGGEPLALRLVDTTGWKHYAFYRRVPSDGKMSVTLALTGIGKVLFDDVRIEPLMGGQAVLTTAAR